MLPKFKYQPGQPSEDPTDWWGGFLNIQADPRKGKSLAPPFKVKLHCFDLENPKPVLKIKPDSSTYSQLHLPKSCPALTIGGGRIHEITNDGLQEVRLEFKAGVRAVLERKPIPNLPAEKEAEVWDRIASLNARDAEISRTTVSMRPLLSSLRNELRAQWFSHIAEETDLALLTAITLSLTGDINAANAYLPYDLPLGAEIEETVDSDDHMDDYYFIDDFSSDQSLGVTGAQEEPVTTLAMAQEEPVTTLAVHTQPMTQEESVTTTPSAVTMVTTMTDLLSSQPLAAAEQLTGADYMAQDEPESSPYS